jgi:hypothetical protein
MITNKTSDIIGFCANCKNQLKESEIFEGLETSYICNNCGYEGYCWDFNTIRVKKEVFEDNIIETGGLI